MSYCIILNLSQFFEWHIYARHWTKWFHYYKHNEIGTMINFTGEETEKSSEM